MSKIKSILSKPVAKFLSKGIRNTAKNAVADQEKWMHLLIDKAKKTRFGIDHHFDKIKSYEDFKAHIPIKDYEGLRSYIDLAVAGKKDILWTGQPKYWAKTSGTTSGVKYIPLTQDSMPNHMNTARNAMFNYVKLSGNHQIFDGKMIFISGSPTLTDKNGIPTGRLSGIVNHEIPAWLKGNQLPSFDTNCIEEWEEKLDQIVEETYDQDMRVISGIPPWVQMYYERLLAKTGKSTIKEIFPNFSLFMYGGVNFSPYTDTLERLVGAKVDRIETYPASEGFIAFQDQLNSNELLLNTNSGIFFEFIPLDEVFNEHPNRLSLADVEVGIDYAIIINNNAGLWGYNIGDTVQFSSTQPYRLVVSGRVKHFISAFGEHVIGKEVEQALQTVMSQRKESTLEFTVAPQVNPPSGLPYHEWFVEFDTVPEDLDSLALQIDQAMAEQNIYYKDLIVGNILRPLVLRPLKKDSFREYMKSQGKLGGQNKVPRLSNDRKIAEALSPYLL